MTPLSRDQTNSEPSSGVHAVVVGPEPHDGCDVCDARRMAAEIAAALKQLVNADLPLDDDDQVSLERELPFWVAARNARATLAVYDHLIGIDGEQERYR